MPDPLLTFLKYIFLALLYLFFLRVLRAVWIELREPRVVAPEGRPEPAAFAEAFSGAQAAAGTTPTSMTDRGATTTSTPVASGRHLVVTSPFHRSGVDYPLSGEVTVGRSPGCSVSLPDDTFVSQVHARMYPRDGEWWVEDLGSTNGTYVNDGRVHLAVVVRDGDQLQFGETVMELRS